MSRFAMHVSGPTSGMSPDIEHLYWTTPGGTFVSKVGAQALGPGLGALGPVNSRNIDAVRIALAVCAADRSVPRSSGGSNWNDRAFDVQVAVSDAHAWEAVATKLNSLVGFLTGDQWRFTFVEEPHVVEADALSTSTLERVVLLSGGADSVIGALLTRDHLGPEQPYALVSHFTSSSISVAQRTIAAAVSEILDGALQQHIQIHLGRKTKRVDGTPFRNEPSSRSRSLLFITLGLAVGSVDEVPLWVPENGFASLNPPLGRDRLGSLSTKTTHPAFLDGLSSLLVAAGAHGALVNPFVNLTKGEMFQRASDLLGVDAASQLLSATNSCAHTGHAGPRPSSSLACGVCFGCTMRRASFAASLVPDLTSYADDLPGAEMRRWVEGKSIHSSMRAFVARGVRPADLFGLSLPPDYPLDDALDLCKRGIAELRDYLV